MHGILIVDKPAGMTSHDVVARIKRFVRPSKVGHSGTLDPAATGVLVVLIGASTRILEFLEDNKKSYEMTIRFGEETDTCDREGAVLASYDTSSLTLDQIMTVVSAHVGEIEQVPPNFSAIKQNGAPLYKLARKGIFPEPPARKVQVRKLSVEDWENPFLKLSLDCSRGTYARSLARDIGRRLGVGGRLESLRRTLSGKFGVNQALGLDEIVDGGPELIRSRLIGVSEALSHVPTIEIDEPDLLRLGQGGCVEAPALQDSGDGQSICKVVSDCKETVIIARPFETEECVMLKPVKVLRCC
jgi:tRNA pseudouridine55 synthase